MQGGHRILLTGKTGIASATIAADGPTSLSTIEMRGLLCGIDHSRLRLLDALSALLDWEVSSGWGEHRKEEFHAVRRARTTFYRGAAQQFLEAVLNISEKLRGLARKAVGDPTLVQQWSSASDGTGPFGLRAAEF
jgi:hypothetical protein